MRMVVVMVSLNGSCRERVCASSTGGVGGVPCSSSWVCRSLMVLLLEMVTKTSRAVPQEFGGFIQSEEEELEGQSASSPAQLASRIVAVEAGTLVCVFAAETCAFYSE